MGKVYKIELLTPDPDLQLRIWGSAGKHPARYIIEFEDKLAKLTHSKYVITTNSGTSALHLALLCLGVNSGDEVLCPTFTFVATVNPIRYCQANPVFVDSENLTWNMCPDLLEEAIMDRLSKGMRPKAVILVHSYGMPAQLERIMQICEHYQIPLVEDAAGALGSLYHNQMLGTFGDCGIISFNNNKIITTAGGGTLLTRHQTVYQEGRYLSDQAKSDVPFYQHEEVGYNYKMNGLAASWGLKSIDQLARKVNEKRLIYKRYYRTLNELDEIAFLDETSDSRSNRWISTVLFSDQEIKNEVKLALGAEGIETRYLWKPMHQQPALSTFPFYNNGTADRLFKRGLCIPSSADLTEADQKKIIKVIKNRITETCKYF